MTLVQEKQPTEQRPREATRFRIDVPLQFRIRGEKKWREGWVDNVSLTDILFSGAEMVEAGKSIEIRLVLPGPRKGHRGGTIVSRAKVKRCWRLIDGVGRAMIAAGLNNPRLLRYDPEWQGSPYDPHDTEE